MLININEEDAEQEDYDKASPLLQIQKFPPTMLIHGSNDSVVDLSDSTDIYRKLVDLVPSELHVTQKKNMLLIHKVDMEICSRASKPILKSIYKGLVGGLNHRPQHYECRALTSELLAMMRILVIS